MADDRRGFLGKLVAGLTGLYGAVLAIPGLAYLGDPLRRRKGAVTGLVRVASLDALPEGVPVKMNVVAPSRDAWIQNPARRIGAVWLVRTAARVRAWTVVCPHLGCAVDFRPDAERFVCPCHDSAFDRSGRRISGPSPRDLDPLEVAIQGGEVWVRFVRFEKGTRDRRVT